jgi:hypothetical protein
VPAWAPIHGIESPLPHSLLEPHGLDGTHNEEGIARCRSALTQRQLCAPLLIFRRVPTTRLFVAQWQQARVKPASPGELRAGGIRRVPAVACADMLATLYVVSVYVPILGIEQASDLSARLVFIRWARPLAGELLFRSSSLLPPPPQILRSPASTSVRASRPPYSARLPSL